MVRTPRGRRPRAARLVARGGAVVVAVALLSIATMPAAHAETPSVAPAEGAGILPGLDARLVGVALEYGTAAQDVRALAEAEALLAALAAEVAALQARVVSVDARLAQLDEVQRLAAAELIQAEADLRRLGALVYAKGGTAWQAQALLQTDNVMDAQRVKQLGGDLSGALRDAMDRAELARKRATSETTRLAGVRTSVQARLEAVEQDERPSAERAVARLRVQAVSSVAGGAVAGLGIPLAAMDAYLRAEGALAIERPSCGITWWMLAGIGRIESNHGRYGGAQLVQGGNTTPRIVGVPLDGSPGVAAISDSDGGRWDDDSVWDRAVGPMQFIPGTWRRYQVDGNGDGASDPNNIYDAAHGAGRYLCNAAGQMHNDASLRRAYLAYNHSNEYASNVLANARGYEATGLPKPVA